MNVSKENLLNVVTNSSNLKLVLEQLNLKDNGGNRRSIKKLLNEYEISITHFNTKITNKLYQLNPKFCKFCGKLLEYDQRNNIFCSSNCSAKCNNHLIDHKPKIRYCKYCGIQLLNNHNIYCSLVCCNKDHYKSYITSWKNGEISGIIGKDDISHHIRRYLFEKYNNSCQICGWSEINQFTGNIPLLIHHIDGNCLNNNEENLLLLCPNCHSLTETFGTLNKGNSTRKDKRIR